MAVELFIASRYLRTRHKELFISIITFLSIAGVAIGVMSLMVVNAVMSGAKSELKARILMLQPHVVLMRYGGLIHSFQSVKRRIETIDSVTDTSPFVTTQGMLRSAAASSGAVLRGIKAHLPNPILENAGITKQEIDTNWQTAENRILLGKVLAQKLKVEKGDWVELIVQAGLAKTKTQLPVRSRLLVVGVFTSGMHEYDKALAYMPIKTAQKLLRMGNAISGIGIQTKDIYKTAETAGAITQLLGFPYRARDWTEMNRNLFASLKLQQTVMALIMILIVLVATFNITSTLVMMVMSKSNDIAILKAMGATDQSIRKTFIFTGMAIGIAGTTLGLIFGAGMCLLLKHYTFIKLPTNVYFFSTLPIQLRWPDVIIIATVTLFICLLASIIPARKASRLDPVTKIRYG